MNIFDIIWQKHGQLSERERQIALTAIENTKKETFEKACEFLRATITETTTVDDFDGEFVEFIAAYDYTSLESFMRDLKLALGMEVKEE